MTDRSRRKLVQVMAGLAALGRAGFSVAGSAEAVRVPCPVRAITAGVNIADFRG